MARFEKQGARKPLATGTGGVWVSDGYDHDAKERIFRISFISESKTHDLVISESDSFEIVKSLAAYHAYAFARDRKDRQK